MPPKKRRRAASAVEDGNAVSSINAATTKPVSLAGFALLPAELKQHVIDLACIASSSSSSPPSKRCLFNTDTATALALSLTSRDLNALATPSLYRAIVIIRPSALYFLHRTLKAHPRRAKLTRRLHIGPLDALPANWWPLDNAYSEGEGWTAGNNFALGRPYTWIKTTLDQAQLPVGYSPNHSWALLRLEPGCREAAITYALEAAQNYLNVDASSEGQNTSTTKVAGILEVQAALDLYLEDIRDSEGEDEKLKRLGQPGARVPAQCRNGNCKHYKTLCITGATARRRISGSGGPLGGTSYVPRTALLRHLARPRTVSDRFDHPLLFARSGFEATVTSNLGSGHRYAYLAGGASYTLGSETWDLQGVHEKHVWPDLALVQRDMMQWEQEYRRRQEDEEDEECQGWAEYAVTCSSILANMGTLGQTMCFVRSMLASLTNLQDLSLTGYLEAIFDDKQQQVGHLRRLSFGPSAPSWNEQLGLVGFTGLEKLHISGIALNEREIRCITNEMPRLQEFRWSMIEQVYISGNLSLTGRIERLLKREARINLAEEVVHREAQSQVTVVDPQVTTSTSSTPRPLADEAITAGSESASQQRDQPNDALIIANLHPKDVLKVLAAAPSPAVADAWHDGTKVTTGQRRLILRENEASRKLTRHILDASSGCEWDEAYEAGKAWWREQDRWKPQT